MEFRPCGGIVVRARHEVAHAAHRLQQVAAQFAAQMVDVDFQGVALQRIVEAVQGFFEPLAESTLPLARSRASSRANSLARRGTSVPARCTVCAAGFTTRSPCSSKGRPGPRCGAVRHACVPAVLRGKGFDEVVVRAFVQAGYAVGQGVAGGHDEHGQRAALLAQPAQPVNAVAVGQAQIEQCHVESFGTQGRTGAGQAIANVHGIARALQGGGQAAGNARIVLDNQNPHPESPRCVSRAIVSHAQVFAANAPRAIDNGGLCPFLMRPHRHLPARLYWSFRRPCRSRAARRDHGGHAGPPGHHRLR